MADQQAGAPLLEASGIVKSFGAVKALRRGALDVHAGEIVALMGANGAGKSTLVKVLTGAHRADAGTIRIRGREVSYRSPGEARAAGLVPVYQEPSLIPDLDVADNLRLSGTPQAACLDWVRDLGVEGLSPDDMAGDLPLATQRILDLARALAVEPDVLILDEMTAALPTDLVSRVLDVLRRQKETGRGVIYISHRFLEISAVCDRAVVLRDGETVGSLAIEEGVEERAVELMLGDKVRPSGGRRAGGSAAQAGTPALRVRNLAVGRKLADVSFELRQGEVLGVVGLEGQGQDELFDCLAGFHRPTGGTIEVEGRPADFRHPADAIAAGVTYVPGDRSEALLMQRSVRENIALPGSAPMRAWGPIPMRREAESVAAAIDKLQIDTRAQGEVRRLSGGNQQKVTIARWIGHGVRTLLCFDPTRGIDVRTKRQIYPLLREVAAQGGAVLLYTSELEEVPLACDRALVIFGGRVVDEVPAEEAHEERLMRAAHGLDARAGVRA